MSHPKSGAAGKGDMYFASLVTGVMQLGFGIYGYIGAEKLALRKVP